MKLKFTDIVYKKADNNDYIPIGTLADIDYNYIPFGIWFITNFKNVKAKYSLVYRKELFETFKKYFNNNKKLDLEALKFIFSEEIKCELINFLYKKNINISNDEFNKLQNDISTRIIKTFENIIESLNQSKK